jgi:hypothetical protein
MHGFQTEDSKTGFACALAYWCFVCRNKDKSPAMGIKTWEYFQSSLVNAAIPSTTLNDFLENFSKKLVVPHLNPVAFTKIINPQQRVIRINQDGELLEFETDQKQNLQWLGWESILNSLAPLGISDRHILGQCRNYPHVIAALVRLRHEEEKALKTNLEDLQETINV